MGAYTNVLVAIDLNKEAIALIEKAKLQLSLEGEIHILHVGSVLATMMPVSSMGSSVPSSVELFQKEYEEESKTYLHQIAQKTALGPEHCHLVFGTEVHEIKSFAEKHHCQLLVLGLHKKKILDRIIGTVAQGTLHNAPCDILSILV